MSFDLSSLNDEQLKPVLDTDGAVLVTAGAGSGKTRLLTHRIAHLIVDKGVSAYNILAITFTNKAAAEMKERLFNMLGGETRGLWVSTFHSMCVSFLRKFIDKIGYTSNFSIYGEQEKERAIKKLLKEENTEEDIVKSVISAISRAKNDGFSPEEYFEANRYEDNAETIKSVYEKYEKELKANNALDFDDLLIKAYYLLVSDKEAGDYYAERFEYIHVDEFQDTNVIQYKIVRALARKHKNILVVGDEDQSIYGWRGASISNISDFRNDFDCKLYKLEQNYRSTKKILALANKLIDNNESRIKKVLWTENEEGDDVEVYAAQSEGNEADFVVSKILALVQNGDCSFSDFSVLMRINALTRSFEERFIQYGIPHKIFGGFKFYDRKEIKDILAYFRIIANPLDTDAILRVINFPKRGIGDKAVGQLINYSAVSGKNLFDVITEIESNADLPLALIKKVTPFCLVLKCLIKEKDNLKLSALMKYLVRMLNLKELFSEPTDDNENRKQNIKELIGSVEQYEQMNPEADINDYLQSVSLYSDLDEMDETAGCVNIATVHSAKGLEFKTVFVVGLEDGTFPISRGMESTFEMEEERRLMYVAITRAEKRLYLSYAQTRFMYGERKASLPSRFLTELGFETRASRRESMYSEYSSSRWYNDRRALNGEAKRYYYERGDEFGDSVAAQMFTRPAPPPAPKRNDKIEKSGFVAGARVRHKKFGEGVIVKVTDEGDNSYAEIEFDGVGKLVLSVFYAPLEVIE